MSLPPHSQGMVPLGSILASEIDSEITYRLEHQLGQGGTAVAYFATRESVQAGQTPVVVKIIHPRLVIDAGEHALTIIKKEAVALGRLNERVPPTPNVVRLLDTGNVAVQLSKQNLQLPWIALEYVHGGAEGTTLADRVLYSVTATGFGFDRERAARVVESLARGLTAIHEVGVIHRDLTPGNVLCCGAGDTEMFKISDFGIARPVGLAATFGDAIVGTPGFVAPEQVGGEEDVAPQSDVFSFAAIVYFILTGQLYFDVSSPTQALVATATPERKSLREAATLSEELRRAPSACEAIDNALARATTRKVDDRPGTAAQLAQSLLPWLRESGSSPQPSRRWFSSLKKLQVEEVHQDSAWEIRHAPGDDRLLTSVGWNASGHCLAASTRGLVFWDGVRWLPASSTSTPWPANVRFVKRLTASSWLVGGEQAFMAEYDETGIRELLRGKNPAHVFLTADGDVRDLAVVVGQLKAQSHLELLGVVGRRWLRPPPHPRRRCRHGSSSGRRGTLVDHWTPTERSLRCAV